MIYGQKSSCRSKWVRRSPETLGRGLHETRTATAPVGRCYRYKPPGAAAAPLSNCGFPRANSLVNSGKSSTPASGQSVKVPDSIQDPNHKPAAHLSSTPLQVPEGKRSLQPPAPISAFLDRLSSRFQNLKTALEPS